MNSVTGIPALLWARRMKIVVSILIVSIVLFLGQGAVQIKRNTDATKANTQAAKENTEATQQLVKDLAQGISDLKGDNEEKLNIIICMLQVPVAQRTTDTEENCRKQAVQRAANPITKSPVSSQAPTPTQQPQSPTPPEQQNPPVLVPPQEPDNDGIIIDLPLLPKIHIPSPL